MNYSEEWKQIVAMTACVGCGQGVVCDVESSATAYCDQCDFDSSLSQCGSYLLTDNSPPTNETDNCVHSPIVVYIGTELTFTGLILLCFI